MTAWQRTAPYRIQAVGLAYTVGILLLDGKLASRPLQAALGALTFAILLWASRSHPADERRVMWFVVAYSTLIELFATQLWGLYTYRLGNVPLFVPPGHGLIYLFAQSAARTPLVERSPRAFTRAVLVIATVWTVSGLTLLPRLTGRFDVHGALYWPFFAWFMLNSRRAPAYAATFLITSIVEIAGTQFGNWHWSPVMPWLALPSADPPSLIAGGYCSFALIADWLAARSWRRSRAAELALAPDEPI